MIEVSRTAKFGWNYNDSIHFNDLKLLKEDKYINSYKSLGWQKG